MGRIAGLVFAPVPALVDLDSEDFVRDCPRVLLSADGFVGARREGALPLDCDSDLEALPGSLVFFVAG
jgi:hypothetical protein